MISGQDFYHVLSALVPLYVAMGLAYASVRWWKIFTPDQCAGINRFVAVFAVPFLSFTFVSSNNFYHMNYRFIAADSLQKAGFLLLLILICNSPFFPSRRLRRIDCVITLFSLSTLPNTLVVGVPLLAAMYGDFTSPLMVQIVVLQSVFWYTILLIMFEYRAAVQFIADQFPVSGTAARISSVRVDPDVVSLVNSSSAGRTVVGGACSIADVDEKGNIHVVVSRRSSSYSVSTSDIKSVNTNNNNNNNNMNSWGIPRASDLTGVEIWSVRSSPRNSNLVEDEIINNSSGGRSLQKPQLLHMFNWNSPNATSFPPSNNNDDKNKVCSCDVNSNEEAVGSERGGTQGQGDHHIIDTNTAYSEITGETKEMDDDYDESKKGAPKGVMGRLVMIMVWKKLIRNPNTYASLLGIFWSLLSFSLNLELPSIVENSVSILANTGLGMAMFSLGLFIGVQPKVIGCGKWMALMAMSARFLLGPGVAAAAAGVVGVRGGTSSGHYSFRVCQRL
ncbi:Probable auxin efflux carrier component 1c [Linum perenne]